MTPQELTTKIEALAAFAASAFGGMRVNIDLHNVEPKLAIDYLATTDHKPNWADITELPEDEDNALYITISGICIGNISLSIHTEYFGSHTQTYTNAKEACKRFPVTDYLFSKNTGY